MGNGAILLAAGAGTRMQGATIDKILHPILGKPLFQYSLEAFLDSGMFSEIVIVYREDQQKEALEQITHGVICDSSQIIWCLGGKERMDSVRNGLDALSVSADLIFIHDCARPMIKASQLRDLSENAQTHGAACLAHSVSDTLKRTDGKSPSVLSSVNRDNLWAMETPQVFKFSDIRDAYEKASEEGIHLTDDTSAIALLGKRVQLVNNSRPNPKITTPEDLDRLAILLQLDL